MPRYKDWCSGKLAHEKVVDWRDIDKWNKESCLKFLAGIVDTDGIYSKSLIISNSNTNYFFHSSWFTNCFCSEILIPDWCHIKN